MATLAEQALAMCVKEDAERRAQSAEYGQPMTTISVAALNELHAQITAERDAARKGAIEECAVLAWNTAMDSCRKRSRSPADCPELFDIVAAIRALQEKPASGNDSK
jgi:hypothetical protein